MGIDDWLIVIVLMIIALFIFKPGMYDSTVGAGLDAGKQAVMDRFEDDVVNSSPIDLGLAYLPQNLSFIKCTSSNICQRIWGESAYCNLNDSHCWKIIT